MIAVLVLIISLVVASLAFTRHGRRKDPRLPPGSMGWPFIGETYSLIKTHPVTSRGDFLENRIAKFGKIFSSHLLGAPAVVSVDPELNRLILKNEAMFESIYPHNINKLMSTFVFKDVHRDRRSLFLKFFNIERIQTVILQDTEKLASHLLAKWEEGSIISAMDESNKFAFYFAVKELLGMDFEDPMAEKLRKEFHTFYRGFIVSPIYVPGTKYWKAFKSRANILNFIKQKTEEMILQKRNLDEITGNEGFLSYLVKNNAECYMNGDGSTDEISGQFLNMLFAGHHSSSLALASIIYFLNGCPKAIEQLREERLQVLKSKHLKRESAITWDDYRNMEFTQCVVNEGLRLSHGAPFLWRKSTSDFYFKGFVIPEGCTVFVHTSGMHLDPQIFDHPEQFNPWRWMDIKNSSGIKKSDSFMPFSGGIRLCLGNVLAQLELSIFIHHLVMNYDWELVEDDHPISTPATVFAKGLNIMIRRV